MALVITVRFAEEEVTALLDLLKQASFPGHLMVLDDQTLAAAQAVLRLAGLDSSRPPSDRHVDLLPGWVIKRFALAALAPVEDRTAVKPAAAKPGPAKSGPAPGQKRSHHKKPAPASPAGGGPAPEPAPVSSGGAPIDAPTTGRVAGTVQAPPPEVQDGDQHTPA